MSARLDPKFRFESFVVGAANRLAATAARAVSESPGRVYNPLFVYAASGLGKTHLLMAIGHAAEAVNPGLTVEYLLLDDFVEAWHAAVGAGQGDAARRRHAGTDLLLLDDVQFLSSRRELQAELLRLLDEMQAAGRQVVLASDRAPGELESLDERLLRRFGGGLVIDIGAPDYETRLAILRRRVADRGVPLTPDALEAIARLEIDNVRELVGALNRVAAQQTVSDHPLGQQAVWALLGAPPAEATPPPDDEFGAFLSEVSATVSRQVEQWRARLGEAVLRWEGDGYRTARLEALLATEPVGDPTAALDAFRRDVEHLRELEREAMDLDPGTEGHPALRDPDDLAGAQAFLETVRQGAQPLPGPSPHWQLDDLLPDPALEVALHASREVAAGRGEGYVPLLLVGGSGTGKTHLLHGIGHRLAAAGAPVACLSAHDFVAELVEALERDQVEAWRTRYRRAQALLLDDVHLLEGKERSQEELFHLFNHLADRRRPMVFTSAVPLADLRGLAPRLRTRLEGGLAATLPAPSRALRRAVARRALLAHGVVEAADLADYLAGRDADTLRALQGLVQRVLRAAEAAQAPASVAMARELLEGAARPRPASRPAAGVVRPAGAGLRNAEKLVRRWPVLADLLVEEYR